MKLQKSTYCLFCALLIFAAASFIYGTGKLGLNAGDKLNTLYEKTFNISPGKNLFVDVSGGDITITTWDKSEVYVKVSGNESAEKSMDFTFEGNDSEVRIKGKKKSSISSWFNGINVKVEVKVPYQFNSDVNTSGGDINYSGVKGKANLNTSGGDVWGDKFGGSLKISTSGGDISLSGSETEIDAHTSGGDIMLDYSGDNMGIDLSTSGGDIDIRIPSGFKASVELSTSGGEISCSHTIGNIRKSSSTKLSGDMNGGGNMLAAHTSGGDVELR